MKYIVSLIIVTVWCSIFNVKMYGYDKNVITEVVASDSEDIIKNVPVYKFGDDVVGSFMDSFLTTMAEVPSKYPAILITDTDDVQSFYNTHFDIKLPEDCIYMTMKPWNDSIVNQLKGVVSLPNKFGLTVCDDEEWLSRLNLVKTDTIFSLHYGKSHITNGVTLVQMTCSSEIWSVLAISDDKKVNPLMIYDIMRPIQDFENISTRFNWIEDFYKTHNMPAGCGYYTQPLYDSKHQKTDGLIAPVVCPQRIDVNP